MGQQRALRRGRSAAAAAAATTPSTSQQQDQEQDDNSNLPAEEAELGDDDAGSSEGSDAEADGSGSGGGDDAGGSDAEQEGSGEAGEAGGDGEVEGTGGAEDEEGEGEEEEEEEEESEGDEQQQEEEEDEQAVQDEDQEEEEEEEEQQEEEEEEDAEEAAQEAAAGVQAGKLPAKKTPAQAAAAAAAARKKAAAAKALQQRLAAAGSRAPARIPMINPAAVLSMSKADQARLLNQAATLRKARQLAKSAAPIEPKRNKTHWDHLLEEAEWMAKEFQRERGWKLKQAKRFVKAVKSSRLDLESRTEVRAQEEALAVRRRAAWVAREVGGFWNKAERVVNYKIYVAIESRKREVLDRHLDMIVGQTERFSKMLARNLVGPAASQQDEVLALQKQQQQQEVKALLAPPPATAAADSLDAAGGSRRRGARRTSSTAADDNQQQQQQPLAAAPKAEQQQQQQQQVEQEPAEDETLAALAGDLLPEDTGAAAAVAADGPAAVGGKRRRSSSGAAAAAADGGADGAPAADAAAAADGAAEAAAAEEDGEAEAPRASKRARRGSKPAVVVAAAGGATGKKAAGTAAAAAGGPGDVDFKSDEEASDDDEATLEEEERLAAEEDVKAEGNELDDLDEEANMPLEELLAKYGFVVPGEDADQQHHESSDDQEEREQQEGGGDDSTAAAAAGDGGDAAADTRQQQKGRRAVKQEPSTAAAADGEEEGGVAAGDGATGVKEGGGGEGEEEEDQDAVVAASRDAAAAQPTGFTLATTSVKTPVPFLLKHTLREYQHIGLDWLVSLYEKRINGILADEMGLGKTIQTVALLAHLACEEGVWGPHLVVVPTSVMLNWEMEFKKWCPAFKLLTYYGSAKERKQKRQGWSKPHAFHVCITSYTLALQDAKVFRRKKWRYLILDEAHMIKNWKSQRWQTLLRFNSKRRLLITGTPLQNDLMELWSLMHFLMPAVFASHAQFKDWFSNPLTGAVETGQEVSRQLVERLHGVLRPFLLRRLKSEVEKQMPPKHEHVLTCNLSKRQRQLYDEYMARSETRSVMSGGNFMGVVGVLMQLRKVCNHPDLFESRPIVSAYDMPGLSLQYPSCVMSGIMPCEEDVATALAGWGLLPGSLNGKLAVWEADETANLAAWPSEFAEVAAEAACDPAGGAKDAAPLQQAAAAAANAAGLVPQVPPGTRLDGRSQWAKMAAAAADNVRHNHGQLSAASGAAAALTHALQRQWQISTAWRASRVALAGALSLQRCGLDLLLLPGVGGTLQAGGTPLQQQGVSAGRAYSSSNVGPVVCGDWLPLDACGVPVGGTSNGRYPDAAGYASAAAVGSSLVLPAGAERGSLAGARSSKGAGAVSGGCRSSSNRLPLCGWDLVRAVGGAAHPVAACLKGRTEATALRELPSLVLEVSPTYVERAAAMENTLREFMFAIPKARAPPVEAWCCKPDGSALRRAAVSAAVAQEEWFQRAGSLRTAFVRRQCFFPDRRLLQYDCGKLVELDVLLRRLKTGGHRVLIFTQMAKMLDLLEAFLNLHGHTYMRLDGSTKPEARQVMMQRFNTDPKYFVFILSTRSGGVGINLTGADTVIFYDSDWNPAMDAQAQDRCHRIGQTREVHIYRLISSNTIEENILRKSDQKRQLDWLAIQSGGFNTEMLAKLNLGGGAAGGLSADDLRAALRAAEDEADVAAAATAEKEVEAEMAEFTNEPPPEELKDEDLEGEDAPTGMKGGTPSASTAAPPPPLPPSGRKGGRRGRPPNSARAAASSPSAAELTPGPDKGQGDDGTAGADSAGGAAAGPDEAAAAGPGPNPDGVEGETAEAQARSMVMKDLAEGQSGQDLLARLSDSLSCIEQYAVRFLEAMRPVDVEAAAAAAVEDIKQEEWDLDAIEKRKEQQELEAEDSEEMVDNWDKAEANAAYREYQEQIAALLKHQEQAAAAEAAAAAAAEAELAEAGGLEDGYGYGSSYPGGSGDYGEGDYSSYPDGGEEGGNGEVTSPTAAAAAANIQSARIRAKREAAALGLGMDSWQQQHHHQHFQLPGGHFQQQQGLAWQQQPFKRQRSAGFGGYAPLEGGLPPPTPSEGRGGRGGRGRGRGGRPPGRGRGAAAGAAASTAGRGAAVAGYGGYGTQHAMQQQGGYGGGWQQQQQQQQQYVKEEYGYGPSSWYNWDEANSSQTLLLWQMLEDAGSISSMCWLKPDGSAAAAGADDSNGSSAQLAVAAARLLPWEVQWDPPLAAAIAAAAAAEAEAAAAAAAAVAAGSLGHDGQSSAAAQHAVGLREWTPEQWEALAEELRGQLAAPAPRTALYSRVNGPACRLRFLQLLDDFTAVQQQHQHAAAAESSSGSDDSSSTAVTGVPRVLEQRLAGVLTALDASARTLLGPLVTAAAAAGAAVGGLAGGVAVKQEEGGVTGLGDATAANGHYLASPPAAAAVGGGGILLAPSPGVQREYARLLQQQEHDAAEAAAAAAAPPQHAVVTAALLQQLASAVDATSHAAAQAAAAAAAAATAACGISTRRQSDSVKAVVGGAPTLVIAPAAAQISSIMDEADGEVLGAGPLVAWGAAYAQAAALATAASGALRSQHSIGQLQQHHGSSSLYGGEVASGAYGARGQGKGSATQSYAGATWDASAAAAHQQQQQQLPESPYQALGAGGGGYGMDAEGQFSPAGSEGANGLGAQYYAAPAAAAMPQGGTGRGRGRGGRPPGRGGRGRGRGRPAGGGRGAAAAASPAASVAAPAPAAAAAAAAASPAVSMAPANAAVQAAAAAGMGLPAVPAAPAVNPQVLQQQQQLHQYLLQAQQQQQQQRHVSASAAMAYGGSAAMAYSGAPQAMLLQQQQQFGQGLLPAVSAAAAGAVQPGPTTSILTAQQQLLLQQHQQLQLNAAGGAAAMQPNHALAVLLAQQQLQQQLQQQQQQQGYVLPAASAALPVSTAAAAAAMGQMAAAGAMASAAVPANPALLQQNAAAGFNAVLGGLNPTQLLQLQQMQQLQQQQGMPQAALLLQLQQQQLAAAAAAAAQGGAANGGYKPPGT